MGKRAALIATLSILGFLAGSASVFAGPVHEAARDGKLTRVEQLIAKDPKLVNSRDDHAFAPLHWAATNGHTEVLTFLLDHGAEPDARSEFGMTPLILVKDGCKDLMVILAGHGADVRAKANNGYSALHSAARYGSQDAADYLLAKGVDVNVRCAGPFGTPLTIAAANGQTALARLLLDKGADINFRTDDGATALHDAAFRGHAETVELLLRRKADVNARRTAGDRLAHRGEKGETPLHDAAQRGHEAVVQLLLAGGADVNARTDLGRTPLHMAPAKGSGAIVKRLVDGGADVNAFSDDGLTPLHAIALSGDVSSAALLLDHGAAVNVRSKRSTLKRIISAKGPDSPPPFENTPLHIAALADRPDMIKLFLSKHADANAKNSLGQTPVQLAKSEPVRKLLQKAGAGAD